MDVLNKQINAAKAQHPIPISPSWTMMARIRLRRSHRQMPEVARLVLPELEKDAEDVWEVCRAARALGN